MNKYTINVVTRLQDNGDGGWTMYVYNTEEEMLKDHHKNKNGKLTEKMKKEILTEYDPYNNGYIGSDSIEVEVVDGVAKLSEKLSFHAGQ